MTGVKQEAINHILGPATTSAFDIWESLLSKWDVVLHCIVSLVHLPKSVIHWLLLLRGALAEQQIEKVKREVATC